ncbi:WecB/TagA/CpsF family glycosyltransferase [Sphingomonas sp. NFX23]|uniref:WecB/TagA/CpsF family glycosyltransferase n=1 Tax=Sphingomonas sp. NFX23 TaxID=2819532 RepID=UPI003CEB7A4A
MTKNAALTSATDRAHEQLGVRFDRKSLTDVINTALSKVAFPTFYVTCNLNHLRVLQSDDAFRKAYRKASVITLDSRPIQIASRVYFGEYLPLVTGAELFSALFLKLRPAVDRPFFICSSNDTGCRLRKSLIDRGFDTDAVEVYSPPFGFERDAAINRAMLSRIQRHRTTHLFMGVGAPKSELWVAHNLYALPPAHIFCVGAALDFTAGLKSRAPIWLGRIGFEWLHRMMAEPSRLMPRYAGDAIVFAKILFGQKLVKVSL